MSIRVVKPGVLTTVQDGGRTGFQAKGFNVSGVMDRRAYRLGNFLVGNYTDEAVLEMSMFGGSFTFLESNYIAITGADMGATIEGVPAPMYETVFVREGDTLSFGAAKDGMYTYIAFAGGLDIPQVLGSRSTNLKCALGGFNAICVCTTCRQNAMTATRPYAWCWGRRTIILPNRAYAPFYPPPTASPNRPTVWAVNWTAKQSSIKIRWILFRTALCSAVCKSRRRVRRL